MQLAVTFFSIINSTGTHLRTSFIGKYLLRTRENTDTQPIASYSEVVLGISLGKHRGPQHAWAVAKI